MSRRKCWITVGGLWGGGVGILFGPIPAAAGTWVILEDWLDGNDAERLAFAALWGVVVLWSGCIGAATGVLLGARSPPTR